jgi:hypothetical protein
MSRWLLAGGGSDDRVNGSVIGKIRGFRFFLASQKSRFLKAEVAEPGADSLANDDMIEEFDFKNPRPGRDVLSPVLATTARKPPLRSRQESHCAP